MTVGWHFDNTYSKLSNTFKENIKPTPVHEPELVILNNKLAEDLNLNFSKIDNKDFRQNYFQEIHCQKMLILLRKLTLDINLVTLQC